MIFHVEVPLIRKWVLRRGREVPVKRGATKKQ